MPSSSESDSEEDELTREQKKLRKAFIWARKCVARKARQKREQEEADRKWQEEAATTGTKWTQFHNSDKRKGAKSSTDKDSSKKARKEKDAAAAAAAAAAAEAEAAAAVAAAAVAVSANGGGAVSGTSATANSPSAASAAAAAAAVAASAAAGEPTTVPVPPKTAGVDGGQSVSGEATIRTNVHDHHHHQSAHDGGEDGDDEAEAERGAEAAVPAETGGFDGAGEGADSDDEEPTAPVVSGTEAERALLLARLTAFYAKHNPQKSAEEVAAGAAQFAGDREEELNMGLRGAYGEDLDCFPASDFPGEFAAVEEERAAKQVGWLVGWVGWWGID